MKKGLLFLLVAGLGFGACDKINEIENFAVGHKFEHPVTLEIGENDPTTFIKDFPIDMSSDQEFKDNLSKISNYTLSTFSYRVAEYTGDDNITATGMVQFTDGVNAIGNPVDLGLINFKEMQNSGSEQDIVISDDLKNAVQDQLLNNDRIVVQLAGMASGKPVTAELVMSIQVEALVKVD